MNSCVIPPFQILDCGLQPVRAVFEMTQALVALVTEYASDTLSTGLGFLGTAGMVVINTPT
jgi:hypothetical protein